MVLFMGWYDTFLYRRVNEISNKNAISLFSFFAFIMSFQMYYVKQKQNQIKIYFKKLK